jgi:hypothetical protein
MAEPTAETIAEIKQSPGRGRYTIYTPEQKAEMGRYAAEHGLKAVCAKFSQELGIAVKESTVRQFKKAYLMQLNEGKDPDQITALRGKKRGRPPSKTVPSGMGTPVLGGTQSTPPGPASSTTVVVAEVNGKDSVSREFEQIVGEMAISASISVS